MAWPTATQSWHPPIAGQQPYASAAATFFDEIDLTVNSIYNHLANRVTSAEAANGKTTIVLSVYPSATATITGTTGIIGPWTVMSTAPFGRLVGNFSVTGSGTNVLFNLATQYGIEGAGQAFTTNGFNRVYYRGVIQAGSISIPSGAINTTNESGWRTSDSMVAVQLRLNTMAVVSLGIGAFTVEMQSRCSFNSTNGSSRWQMATGDWLLLTATQVGR